MLSVIFRGRKNPALLFLSFVLSVFAPALSHASDRVTLVWIPNSDPSVAGFNIYYGGSTGAYTNQVSAGNATSVVVTGLVEGASYYFVATAINTNGLESDFSNEVLYSNPVVNTNQGPTLDALVNLSINENVSVQTVSLTGITSGTTNALPTLTITATSDNASVIPAPAVSYTSPAATGSILFAPIANAIGSATISVTVDNGGSVNNLITRSFLVTVNSVNQPPTLNPLADLTINENAGLQTVNLSGITSGALNELQNLAVTVTSSNPALIPTPTVNYNSPSSVGSLTFRPVANAYGSSTVTVTVFDGIDIFSRTFAVNVTPINQPPTLNPLTDLTISENANLQTVNLTGITSGASSEVQTLTLTATSSNPALIPNPAINYTSPNQTGSLLFTPVAFANGSTTVTVTVSDGIDIFTRSFVVNVSSVNQAPTLNALSDFTINQNSGLQTVVLAGITSGAANEIQTLTLTAISSNPSLIPAPSISYTSPNQTGSVSFTPIADAHGAATITVSVNDGAASNNIVARSFTVTVNQLPTISAISDHLIALGTPAPTIPFTIGDAETPAANLTLSAASSNPALVQVSGLVFGGTGANRTVTISPVAGQIGVASITITVGDGMATTSRAFQLRVENKPAPPGTLHVAGP